MEKKPASAVDIAVTDGQRIVLVKRGREPFRGRWALPGGFVEYGETVESAALREVFEETSMLVKLEAVLGVYSAHDRDPRGHTLTSVFVARSLSGEPQGGDDAAAASWVDLESVDVEDLAFDHGLIVEDLKKWLKEESTFWSTKDR
ncbi:MAG: NUDIX domain-containing protein [Candidatus Thorarchaeota archaeon]